MIDLNTLKLLVVVIVLGYWGSQPDQPDRGYDGGFDTAPRKHVR